MYRFNKIIKNCYKRNISNALTFNFLDLKNVKFDIDLYEYFSLPREDRSNLYKSNNDDLDLYKYFSLPRDSRN